jgi:hypothetical protein
VEVNKSITGSPLLDIGQTLTVKTVISTDQALIIDRVEDPIPGSMDVSDYPSGCSVQMNLLRCDYGTEVEGKITITYTLIAKSKDKKIPLEQARVYYETDGIPSAAISNVIPTSYYIGPPELNLTSQRIIIDGIEQSPPYMALPESSISFSFAVKNSGAVNAENVTVAISINQWGILQQESEEPFQPSEERAASISFTAPKSEGSATVEVKLSWTDPILFQYKEIEFDIPIEVSRPKVKVTRLLELKWVNIEDELTPIIFLQYNLRNQGKLPAKVVLEQEVPDLENLEIDPQGITRGRNTTIQLQLDAGESAQITLQGEVIGKEQLTVPASVMDYYDSRDYQYETFAWDSETVQISYSIWATLYSLVGPFGVMGKVLILTLFIICAVTLYRLYKVQQENWYWIVLPLFIISLFIVSYFVIEGLTWLFEIIIAPIGWIIELILNSF